MSKAVIYDEYFNAQNKLEEQYGPDSIVLMMVGSFYEIYGVELPNAQPPVKLGKTEQAHNILGMNMTRKSKAKEHSVDNPYMVGFPDYAIDEHLGKLLRANMTVALYDQYDHAWTDTKGKQHTKKVRRCAHIYTPSTYIDDTMTETNSLLVCEIGNYKSPVTGQTLEKVHVAVLNLGTGKVDLLEAYDTREDIGKAQAELYRIIHTYNPSEVIYCSEPDDRFAVNFDLGQKKVYFRYIPNDYRKPAYQNTFLKKIYKTAKKENLLQPIDTLGLEKHSSVIPHLIQALQFAFEQDKLIVTRIHKPTFIEASKQLILNNDSIYQLNLVESPYEISTTLYKTICKARTPMGRRCVRQRLLTPIMDPDVLEYRYDHVEAMQEEHENYLEYLRNICDIEKKYRKMVMNTLQPYELSDMKSSFSAIKKLLWYAEGLFNITQQLRDQYEAFYQEYKSTFNFSVMKRCKLKDIRGSFFIKGVNKELDKIQMKISDGQQLLEDIAEEFSEHIEPGKDSVVKVESTEKEGWYLVTTKKRFAALPNTFTMDVTYHGKVYTMTFDDLELTRLSNSVKIRSKVIKNISRDILSQRTRLNHKIQDEYLKVLDHYVEEYGDLFIQVSDHIADIDFVYSAARVASENGYTRPIIKNDIQNASYVNVIGVRHPIIEQLSDAEYTTNDLCIGRDEHYGSIIYGLNMSGKSSLLKAIGCNIVMAQAGMFVSCEKLVFNTYRYLLSKMTIRDNMTKGQSTFMVEMLEVKRMLTCANRNTLVLSDELCSSTESTSGHAIVAQTLHELAERRANFLFSTHLHELQKIPLVVENPHIKIYHFKVHINGNKIVFDRHIEEGGMTDLYGLEVARALGLPETFMRGAFTVRDLLTNQNGELLSTKKSRYNAKIYVDSCTKCGSTDNLHTHHLRHQSEADEKGLIDKRFHKNRTFNLQVLCEKCHQQEHRA